MKRIAIYISVILAILSFNNGEKKSGETVIYIVRHAEKDTSNLKNPDPGLTSQGRERAKALALILKRKKLAAVFSTTYKRTTETAAPAAQRSGLPVMNYINADQLVNLIKSSWQNKTILIVGHSNTVLEIAKGLGAHPPIQILRDDDYDFLFKVTIDKNGDSDLKITRFGKVQHSTKFP